MPFLNNLLLVIFACVPILFGGALLREGWFIWKSQYETGKVTMRGVLGMLICHLLGGAAIVYGAFALSFILSLTL